MQYKQGRLIDHVHLRVADLPASRRFYRAVLGALDLTDAWGESDEAFYVDELYVDATPGLPSHVHLAFQAQSVAAVRAFHEAGLAAGGRDNGAPGSRDYHPQYYAAFLLDPDGNNIEAVCDQPSTRSADAVTVTREPSRSDL